jgi:hypothetical protein
MLNIVYVEQEQANWCWAACCQMVFDLTEVTVNGNPIKQCEMATAQFHGACCSAPGSSICDQGCWPENVYDFYEFNFLKTNSALSLDALKLEINSGRPVEVCFVWNGNGAHVALVGGYYDNGDLEVYDPYYGQSRNAYSDVLNAYGKGGSWTITYSNLRK